LRADAAAPQSQVLIVSLSNEASSPCQVRGYPVVQLRDQRGALLPFGYLPGVAGQLVPTVNVSPGGLASFAIVPERLCGQGPGYRAVTITTTLPSSNSAGTVLLPADPVVINCDPTKGVLLSPIEPTAQAAVGFLYDERGRK
jgi:hypothetical protein